jgi:hypothetical protein
MDKDGRTAAWKEKRKRYIRGEDMENNRIAPADHRTKLRLQPFKVVAPPVADPAADIPAGGGMSASNDGAAYDTGFSATREASGPPELGNGGRRQRQGWWRAFKRRVPGKEGGGGRVPRDHSPRGVGRVGRAGCAWGRPPRLPRADAFLTQHASASAELKLSADLSCGA